MMRKDLLSRVGGFWPLVAGPPLLDLLLRTGSKVFLLFELAARTFRSLTMVSFGRRTIFS